MRQSKTLLFASDHAGLELKNSLVDFARGHGYRVIDLGPRQYISIDNYPETIAPLAERISSNPDGYIGIVVGGSGQGEAIVCNRFAHVRAAVYYGGPMDLVILSRRHNDANVLSFGARFLDEKQAKDALQVWLRTDFEGGRHVARVSEIEHVAGSFFVRLLRSFGLR